MQVFFSAQDSQTYKNLIAEHCKKAQVEVLAWCLMPNHVHLVLVPGDEDGLRRALGDAHRRYTRHINLRENWRGHLWQDRFHSFAMGETHLLEAVRYIELNPVRAGLARHARDWRWSSARAHLDNMDDGLVSPRAMLDRIADWQAYLDAGSDDNITQSIHHHSRSGLPLGDNDFIAKLETILKRSLRQKKAGRPKKGD